MRAGRTERTRGVAIPVAASLNQIADSINNGRRPLVDASRSAVEVRRSPRGGDGSRPMDAKRLPLAHQFHSEYDWKPDSGLD